MDVPTPLSVRGSKDTLKGYILVKETSFYVERGDKGHYRKSFRKYELTLETLTLETNPDSSSGNHSK